MSRMTSPARRLGRIIPAAGLSALVLAAATPRVGAAHTVTQPAATYTLTIGTSMPLTSAAKPLADGVNKAVQLAVLLANQQHLLPNVTFTTRLLDDVVGNNYSPDKDAANARVLIADPTVVGVVGPLNSGATEASMPIYNNAGLTNISPSATLVLLTDPANLARFQPATAAGKGPRTFFRTITSDAVEGRADAAFVHQHYKTVYVTDNKDPYGTGVANEFKANAQRIGARVVGSGELEPNQAQMGARSLATVIRNVAGGNVDLVYFGGEFGATGGAEFLAAALHRVGLMHTVLMGPVGIFDPSFIKAATPAIANGTIASTVGYPPNAKVSVPPVANTFANAFKRQYPGVGLADYDNEAFDAANVIIQATVQAIKAGQLHPGAVDRAGREAVARNIAAIHLTGATGPVSFDRNGDTSIHAVISVFKVVNGVWTFQQYAPGYAPQ